MKLFKVFLSLFLIVGLIFIISLFFPHTYKVDRKTTIHKPVNEVFSYMDDLRNWPKWSLWNKDTDSTLYFFYGHRSDSLGGRQYFNGNLIGGGRFEFVKHIPNQQLSYNLYMHQGEVNANGTFYFAPLNANETEISWVDSGDVGYNPLFRFMLPGKTSSTEKSFDNGLSRIKANLEK